MSITPCRTKWKGTMTDRERFNNQMYYKPVDRSFNMEFGYWEENYNEWSIFTENKITNENDANIFFNFDKIRDIGGSIWLNPHFENRIVEETETTKIIMNGDGLLAEIPKDGHDTIPHFIKATIVTPEDWKKCKEERLNRDNPARKADVEALK